MENLNPLLQNLIYAVATVLAGLFAYLLRNLINVGVLYLTTRIGNENLSKLIAFGQLVVRALEQSPIYTEFDGAKKKELAIVWLTQYCEQHKIPVDRALIDKVIESSVQIMNTELGKLDIDDLLSDMPVLEG